MSTLEKDIYKRQKVSSGNQSQVRSSQAYRGISTVNPARPNVSIYDISLIKQDLINHFHIRKGEKLENPEFGTIIWDTLFEPLTDEIKTIIAEDVTEIINYDPRTQVIRVTVDSYESGIQIEFDIRYIPYNISESLRLRFDQENGLI